MIEKQRSRQKKFAAVPANGGTTAQGSVLLYLLPDALLTHPRNMRRFYHDDEVREMAESMRARIQRGEHPIIHALRIVPNGKAGQYFIVDGNIRLAAARLLGKECPPLKCELTNQNEADQLLDMVVTAKMRFTPDPVSEAIHYKRLIDEEHYSIRQIAKTTGINPETVKRSLKLLELDKEIQEFIAKSTLPQDLRAVNAFLSIPDRRARLKLAERAVHDGMTVKAIVAACERLVTHMSAAEKPMSGVTPSLSIARQRAFGRDVIPSSPVRLWKMREAAKATCENCEIKSSLLKSAPEPAWALMVHAAESTCSSCDLREVRSSCGECPAVDILRRLMTAIGEKRT